MLSQRTGDTAKGDSNSRAGIRAREDEENKSHWILASSMGALISVAIIALVVRRHRMRRVRMYGGQRRASNLKKVHPAGV